MVGYFYDLDGYPHYYTSIDELLDEAKYVIGDDYVRALKLEIEGEIQRRTDEWEFLNSDDYEDDEDDS